MSYVLPGYSSKVPLFFKAVLGICENVTKTIPRWFFRRKKNSTCMKHWTIPITSGKIKTFLKKIFSIFYLFLNVWIRLKKKIRRKRKSQCMKKSGKKIKSGLFFFHVWKNTFSGEKHIILFLMCVTDWKKKTDLERNNQLISCFHVWKKKVCTGEKFLLIFVILTLTTRGWRAPLPHVLNRNKSLPVVFRGSFLHALETQDTSIVC